MWRATATTSARESLDLHLEKAPPQSGERVMLKGCDELIVTE